MADRHNDNGNIGQEGKPMTTMHISLPEPLKQFIDEEVREGSFSSTSDYVRDLIRQRQRAKAENRLRELVAESLASGSAGEVTADTVAKLCQTIRHNHGS